MESAFYVGPPTNEQAHNGQQFPIHNPEAYASGSNGNEPRGLEQQISEESPEEGKRTRLKRKRASKACDACRVRKVKCDATRIPCPQCAEHDIPCLFTVPAKKRGPPNAYVEAQKAKMAQQHQQNDGSVMQQMPFHPYQDSQNGADPRSYGMNAAIQAPLYQAHSPNFGTPVVPRTDIGLEELADPEVLNFIFDDFFTAIYPICPIILETQFRRTLSSPPLYTDDFLALCASIMSVTVAILRSNTVKYASLTLERCRMFALNRLGTGYRERMNVSIAATLEYLALSSGLRADIPIEENLESAMIRAEFSVAVQLLVATQLAKGSMSLVDAQLLKRMYTYIYYAQISLSVQGLPYQIDLESHTKLSETLGLDMVPLDLSDMELERLAQAGGDNTAATGQLSNLLNPSAKSYVPGLILYSGLYRIYLKDMPVRKDDSLEPAVRTSSICETLKQIRHFLEDVPEELRWQENNKVHGLGFEVQKANLHVSGMHLSSLLLEKCHELNYKSGADGAFDIDNERRHVISETLRITKEISERALEANGYAMVKRVRQIASALVEIIQSQPEGESVKAKEELSEFVEILGALDTGHARGHKRGSPVHQEPGSSRDESWRRFRNEETEDAQ
ncbi:Putative uncharacterized protein [Taphrina deformans PYCC 5710]|uniref:Zn(2)-C6 fungal-type domain-containing protein n=1 Tax=Taphrina deformans (strain PYCC 5710 / ATCC 11124 / CBS 356.35 / IMI 108563 / JCM 9778 / NBRC 8474) TaxID=1097556 RepID=R4X979_TAPDE|nr:Putative uncharacterized protein [Taphrina deformans PYCC 5710]|eukprot:CCG80732.1 Putative uncharacterized protein [Taphrina deformans PYCC 5710]